MGVRTLLLALALTALPATASAQGRMSEAARNLYESGSRAFAEGRFAEAARAFREAHAISHEPALLFNLGRALEASGDDAGALEALTLFRDAGASGFDRAALDRQIDTLRQRVDEARARAAEAAQNPAQPPPPPPQVRTVERTVIQPAWYRVEYRRSTVSTVMPWALVGVGGALGVAALIQGLVARGDINTLNAANRGDEPWNSGAQDALGRASGEATRTYIFAGAGGAFVLGGVLWLLLRGPGERVVVNSPPQLTLLPGGGAGLTLGGSL